VHQFVPVGKCTAWLACAAPVSAVQVVSSSPSLVPASSGEPTDAGTPGTPVAPPTSLQTPIVAISVQI